MTFFLAAEGVCDLAVAAKLVEHAGHSIAQRFNCRGKGNLDKKYDQYNAAAKHADWFVLRDLDDDAVCAPDFIKSIKFSMRRKSARLRLRIAIRSLEAWLMADREALAAWLEVPRNKIPSQLERVSDPKTTLVNLARKSRNKELRAQMVPDQGTGASVGPEYEAALLRFIEDHWEPARAIAGGPDSLVRAYKSLC